MYRNFACVYVYTPHECSARDVRRDIKSPGKGAQTTVSCFVGATNWTLIV